MTSTRPSRRPRGRVIVVADAPGCAELDRPVVRAANLFDAVGEVTVAKAAEPVEAVVMPASIVRGFPKAVDAFRRVDPAVRLILIVPRNGEASEPDGLWATVDVVLVEPVSAADLSQAIVDGVPAPPRRRPAPPAPPAPPPTPRGGDADVVAAEIETFETAPAAAGGQLGDTDLVEAILADPAGLRDRALRLVVQQTGWADLALVNEAPAGDSGAAEVTYGPRRFGLLVSRRASVRDLRPWAEWLARWLALDQAYREYRVMAFRDELTGAWNRRFFEVFMKRIIGRAARTRRQVTLLVFDIDDFKVYNDEYGHEAGDEILRETVRLLNSVIRAGDRVCRIGGDEFVVIFADPEGPRERGSNPPETVEAIASRFQDQICQMKFPKLGPDAPGSLSISGGLSTYPWDGADAETLLRHADQLALQSKRSGKNVITVGKRAVGDKK